MAISLVSLVDTFLSWMNKTNELITIANLSTEGQLNTSGTIKITNSTLLADGVSLNVANGMLKGDGGLLTNVQTVIANSAVTNAKLANPGIRIISNSATITITGGQNANLGGTVYVDIGALSSRVDDQSTANIASANAVNLVQTLAQAAFVLAGSGTTAGPAFDKANAANVLAFNTNITAAAGFDKANAANLLAFTADASAAAAFGKANAANVIASAAFDAANNAGGGGYYKGNQGTIGDPANVGDIFRVNHSILNANVTINDTERAVAVGPLTVNTGVVLTITGNGRAVIV